MCSPSARRAVRYWRLADERNDLRTGGLCDPLRALQEDDRTWAVNRLLEVMRLDAIEAAEPEREPLHVLLERLTEEAVTRGICADDQVSRDLF